MLSLPFLRPAFFRFSLAGLAFLSCLALAIPALQAQNPTSADGFDPNFDGTVYAQAIQADGRILVGGNFTTVRPNGGAVFSRQGVARLNVDGTVDTTFVNPGVAGTVSAIVVQSDGKIVIGGSFTSVQPETGGGAARQNLARLNADGTLDASFSPAANVRVNTLALQADGRIVVGGSFTSIAVGALTTLRNHVARLETNGTVDQSFNPNASQPVLAAAVQADGRILIGGFFTSLQPNGGASVTRNRLARLNVDGTLDSTFDPSPSGEINTIVVQPDARILIGGNFTSLTPNGAPNPAFFPYAMRLNLDGSIDRTFYPRPNGAVLAIKLQSDGRIVLGGRFTTLQVFGVNGGEVPRLYLARFRPDGTLDSAFDPVPNFHVHTIEQQADGKLLLGGNFNQFRNQGNSAVATVRNQYARLNADGSVDSTLDPNTNGRVRDIAVQSDGKVVLAGNFASVGGLTRNFLARVGANGALDTAFAPEVNGPVNSVAVQSDGKIVIAGGFTSVNSQTRSFIARLNADGSLDPSFDPSANFNIEVIALQADGKILVGGLFTSFTPNGATDRVVRNRLARLNADGTVDAGFDPDANDIVYDIVPMSNGQILISGTFTGLRGTSGDFDFPRDFVARLNANGTLDHSFTIHPGGAVNFPRSIEALAVQADGKVIVVGAFVRAAGSSDTDFRSRNRIVRYNSNGTIDPDFNPNANAVVNHVLVQSDGKILISGGFTAIGGVARVNLARLNADGTLDTGFDPNPDGQLGTQPGAIELESDGQVLVSGAFSAFRPNGGSSVPRAQIARLNATGTVDTGFDAGIGGQPNLQIDAIAMQPDGRMVLGGNFTTLGGANSANLARFNADSSPDTTFAPNPNGPVHAVAIRPGITPVPSQTPNFAWLNADGNLRGAFDPGTNVRIEGQVFATAAQADGKILIGGAFTNLASTGSNNLLRLNADGTLDTSFAPSPDQQVNQIIVLPDGKILVAGAFGSLGGVGRQRIARLHANGSVDLDFVNTNTDGLIINVLRRSDGKLIVIGNFETMQPPNESGVVNKVRLALLNENGTIDKSFGAAADGTVSAIAQQPDGKLVIGGTFTLVQGTGTSTPSIRLGIARLNADGSLDAGFDPNKDDTALNTTILALAVQGDGQILVGGSFTSFAKQPHSGLVRLNADGTVDTSFDPNPNGLVAALGVQPDGRILVGGQFSRISSVTRNNMARLLASGTVDPSFNLNTNGRVNSFTQLPDGTILLGGTFTTVQPAGAIMAGGAFTHIGGIAASNLALLNADGTAGSPFQPNPNGTVFSLAAQRDGRVLVGGAFTAIGGLGRNRLARISGEGAIDTGFNPDVNGTVLAIALQADERIVIGGSFSSVGGVPRSNIARLNADGTVDGSFDPGANGTVNVVLVRADGSIVVGGEFTAIGGAARSRLARLGAGGTADGFNPGANGTVNALALQSDGRLAVGGDFTLIAGAARNRIARFNPDDSLDAFDPSADAAVTALTIQEDGKTVVGGRFSRIGGRSRNAIARFGAASLSTTSIAISDDLSTATWLRSGSSPDLSAASFESSTDGVEWRSAGNATRIGATGNWQLGGLSLSVREALFLRARGVTQASQYTSTGLVEEIAGFFPRPVLTSASSVTGTLGASFLYAISTSTAANSYAASGLPSGLSLDASSGLISGTPGQAGTFNVTITATSAAGSANSTLTIDVSSSPGGTTTAGRLIALSTRSLVKNGSPLVSGVVVSGSGPKSVLFRAVGPGLTPLGVGNVLAAPLLRLFDSGGNLVLESRAWGGSPALAATFARLGEFPLDPNSADAAVLVTLNPGSYTAQVLDGGLASTGGTVLAEVYDASASDVIGAPRLTAISSRGLVDSAGNTVVGGLVIAGSSPKTVILRGVGPNLTKAGVSGALADPVLTLFNSSNQVIARNDNWQTPVTVNPSFPSATGTAIASASTGAGLAAFDSGSADAALLITLAPGVYTVQVSAATTIEGTGMVEIYEAP